MAQVLALRIHHEEDVVTARQRAAQVAIALGFDQSEQTRIATAVSEIVRNAFRYAQGGSVEFHLAGDSSPQVLEIVVRDTGGGIPHLDQVLSGQYKSETGMGMGLVGTRRLMDRFHIQSTNAGTTVSMAKVLPRRAAFVSRSRLEEIARTLTVRRPTSLVEEVQRQNQELVRTLDELNRRQEELVRLNRELEDTNRGVVALYAELDERADHLRRADELKSRFLSNMTHEFRTPVNSILALASILKDVRRDAGLAAEPEVEYIRKAAEQLSDLVNDLLDLAKVEAGKTEVRVTEFDVEKMFGALRGMLRPLLVGQSVALVFDAPGDLPMMRTDEGKVSQILRNLISNALKFTERGEVRVSVTLDEQREAMVFAVSDTGIGIASGDQERIFDEFSQVDNPLQRKHKGTGLGLPLSRKLATLLGGELDVSSTPGLGSTFTLRVPVFFRSTTPVQKSLEIAIEPDPERLPVLVVEDAFEAQLFFERALKGSSFQMLPARSLREANEIIATRRPAAIVLDIVLHGEESWSLLAELKRNPDTAATPVVVISTLDEARKGMSLGADVYAVKPVDRRWLLDTLARLTHSGPPPLRVLVIDDHETAHHIVRHLLPAPRYTVADALTGGSGVAMARSTSPDAVVLDLNLPDMDGRDVLAQLKSHPETAHIPVIIVSSQPLTESDRLAWADAVADVVPKHRLTRETLEQSLRAVVSRGVRVSGT
jgi:signal transduction histidine kinase/DNA-binding response OmpR family regulator